MSDQPVNVRVDAFCQAQLREACQRAGEQLADQFVRQNPIPGVRVGFVLMMFDANGPGGAYSSSFTPEQFAPAVRTMLDAIQSGDRVVPPAGRIIV